MSFDRRSHRRKYGSKGKLRSNLCPYPALGDSKTFEDDIQGVIRSRQSKVRQCNDQRKMDNDLQSTENQLLSRTLNRGRRELGCHGRVNVRFRTTSSTRRVSRVIKLEISDKLGMDRILITTN